jgi:hypothetical protein
MYMYRKKNYKINKKSAGHGTKILKKEALRAQRRSDRVQHSSEGRSVAQKGAA